MHWLLFGNTADSPVSHERISPLGCLAGAELLTHDRVMLVVYNAAHLLRFKALYTSSGDFFHVGHSLCLAGRPTMAVMEQL
jgi:hypothetical protein